MKLIYILVAIALVGGAYLSFSDKGEESVVDVEVSSSEVISEDEQESEEDGVSEKVFTIDSFAFGYSETEIRVKKGDMVTINLTNSGGFHDWVVDEFGAATEKINAGGVTSVTFVADTAGTFEYYCSVGHHRAEGMVGTLVVE